MNRPWHRHYHSDFRIGTRSLSLEERGAYITLLDLMYAEGVVCEQRVAVEDSDRDLAHECKVSIRKWRSIRERLIAKGKLVAADGYLINPRAETPVAESGADSDAPVEFSRSTHLHRIHNARRGETL